jgi:hypothetical protein
MSAAHIAVPPRPDFGASVHSSASAELQQHVSHIIAAAAHHHHHSSEGDSDHDSDASDDGADEASEDEDSGVF